MNRDMFGYSLLAVQGVLLLILLSSCNFRSSAEVHQERATAIQASEAALATSEFVKSEPDEHGVVCYTRPQASHIQFACVKVR